MIFLCFSSKNRYTVVKSCLYHLKNYGMNVWYDYHELILGDKKKEKNFIKAINNCDYFIIIYSNDFFNSPCAINEEKLIFEEENKRNIVIFPLLYNMKYSELPHDYQSKIENRIYNEITDKTGSIDSINQIIVKILLDKMGYDEFTVTPQIDLLILNNIKNDYLKDILYHYLQISKDNFNSRISFLFCIYKYIKYKDKNRKMPEYLSQPMEYLSHYTTLNIPYNHKELIIAELVIINLLILY